MEVQEAPVVATLYAVAICTAREEPTNGGLFEQLRLMMLTQFLEYFQGQLPTITRVAFVGSELVGGCVFSINPQGLGTGGIAEGMIVHIFAVPDQWGEGVAKALMDDAIRHFEAARLSRARLLTDPENHRAQAFFQREGFESGLLIPICEPGVPEGSYMIAFTRQLP